MVYRDSIVKQGIATATPERVDIIISIVKANVYFGIVNIE